MKSKIIDIIDIIDIIAGIGIGLFAMYIVALCIDEMVWGY